MYNVPLHLDIFDMYKNYISSNDMLSIVFGMEVGEDGRTFLMGHVGQYSCEIHFWIS